MGIKWRDQGSNYMLCLSGDHYRAGGIGVSMRQWALSGGIRALTLCCACQEITIELVLLESR